MANGVGYMKIDKALRKERKIKEIYFSFMVIIFVTMPLTIILDDIDSTFIWMYMAFVQLLIILACLIKSNYYKLDFSCKNNILKLKTSLFTKTIEITCDQVVLVHTVKQRDELEILIVWGGKIKRRDKVLKPIGDAFMKRYSEISESYLKIKELNTESTYYYKVIRKGGYRKYRLLEEVYKNCVKARYTTSAIDSIKIARGQLDI